MRRCSASASSPCWRLRRRFIGAPDWRRSARAEDLQKTALNARRALEAELKTAGIHVLNIHGKGAPKAATRDGFVEALSDLLAAEDCAQLRSAVDGLAQDGKALSMRCAGRIDGETYAVNGFASGAGGITLILRDCTRENDLNAELSA